MAVLTHRSNPVCVCFSVVPARWLRDICRALRYKTAVSCTVLPDVVRDDVLRLWSEAKRETLEIVKLVIETFSNRTF